MLDIGWSELAVVALIAVIIIGPKDLPKVLQTLGRMMAKVRQVTQEFQSGIDDMIRQAELEEAKHIIAEAKKMKAGGLEKTIDPTGVTRDVEKDLKNLETSAPSGKSTAHEKDSQEGDRDRDKLLSGGEEEHYPVTEQGKTTLNPDTSSKPNLDAEKKPNNSSAKASHNRSSKRSTKQASGVSGSTKQASTNPARNKKSVSKKPASKSNGSSKSGPVRQKKETKSSKPKVKTP